MTKQEYHEHLCSVIYAVMTAENAVNKNDSDILNKVKAQEISPDEYISMVADEILSGTSDEELTKILDEEWS